MDIINQQGRKWQLVINEPLEKGYTHTIIKEKLALFKSISYYCLSDEMGQAEHTFHTHIFFFCTNPVRFGMIKKRFYEAHIERANGTCEENRIYIAKEGKWKDLKGDTIVEGSFEEFGTLPVERQGARGDLEEIYQFVLDGLTNAEILDRRPSTMMCLDKIEKARQTVREAEYRNVFRDLEVIYTFGATGTGKTRHIMETYGYECVYRVTEYEHPFDSYMGQDVLLLDEFHSSISLPQMLTLCEGYPMMLPCRYADRVACFTKVYIVSNLPLDKQYQNGQCRDSDTFAALLRRIDKVRVYTALGEFTDWDTKEYMDNPFLRDWDRRR